jgi:uncharacterized protein involved in tolerance to divalent cations
MTLASRSSTTSRSLSLTCALVLPLRLIRTRLPFWSKPQLIAPFTPVRSIYRWQGQVHERPEGRVSLNTSRERVAEIVARAQREHPYEVPGVSTRPIIDGNPDYLAWIAKETDTGSGQPHGPAT